ncbi:MAG: spoII [Candidatus Taylorbacteria bacterium]|nr:spoII [Candidatus Taylorbacteria bacterium]
MEDIKEITKSLIDMLGVVETTIEIVDHNGGFLINIKSPEEYSLIGRENEKFEAFSHLVKRMVAKKRGEEVRIIVDINGVRAQNDELIKSKAAMLAERARSFKIDVEMDPMTSYERMLVHSHLEGRPNIKTESIGEGKERKLVIRFVEDIASEDKI